MSFRSLNLMPANGCAGTEADYQETYEFYLNAGFFSEPNDIFPLVSLEQYMELAWKVSNWDIAGEIHLTKDLGLGCTYKVDQTFAYQSANTTSNIDGSPIVENTMSALVCGSSFYSESLVSNPWTETYNCPPQVINNTDGETTLSYVLSGTDLFSGRKGVYKISENSYRISMEASGIATLSCRTTANFTQATNIKFTIELDSGNIELPMWTVPDYTISSGFITATKSQERLAE